MDLIPIIAKREKRVQGFRLREGVWIDVGRPRDLIRANLVAAERYGKGCEAGGTNSRDGPFYVGKGTVMENTQSHSSVILDSCDIADSELTESLIMQGCNLQGITVTRSILGKGCVVGRGSKITDCVLRDGTIVPENTVLEKRIG